MGLRWKLTLLVPGLLALGLITIAFVAAEQERGDEEQDLRMRSLEVLEAVSVAVSPHLAAQDYSALATLIGRFFDVQKEDGLRELYVLDPTGTVLAHSHPILAKTRAADAFSVRAAKGDSRLWQHEGSFLSVAVPVEYRGYLGVVVAKYSLGDVEGEVARARLQWLGLALVLWLLVGVVLFSGIDGWVLQPIAELQDAVRLIGEGELSRRVPPLPGREMAELSNMVNRMAGALESERDNLERSVDARTRELQELNSRLEQLSVTDALTGIYNHRRFQESLASELLRAHRNLQPFSVLMIDVDHFKKVNDLLGHPIGDELLRQLSAVLGQCLRKSDLLARYGGEEFAALLPGTDKQLALQVAERMRAVVDSEMNSGAEWPQHISISIGVATWPMDGQTKEALVASADAALYEAKHGGRNRVIGTATAA
ncbi:MAG: diguanylate cyclase [Myxococcaceae bacterium]|nr:diguanylate cyclase [Myxococcaceae bacterium]